MRRERPVILSAKHGLVQPHQKLEPYDVTLAGIRARVRRAWAKRVAGYLLRIMQPGDRVVCCLGMAYAEFLHPVLREAGTRWTSPCWGSV